MPDAIIDSIPGVRCAVGESPVWHAGEQAWYWVDIPARRIWRMIHATGRTRGNITAASISVGGVATISQ